MLTTMSWAVTAWPPVGGLGGRITHRHPRTASTYANAHTHTQTYIHTDIDTHTEKPTHYLNSLDLTLHTAHLTDNSHSDFRRDEKCFRATRRLVRICFQSTHWIDRIFWTWNENFMCIYIYRGPLTSGSNKTRRRVARKHFSPRVKLECELRGKCSV